MGNVAVRAGQTAWRAVVYYEVGRRMNRIRGNLGLTLTEACEKMGTTTSTLGRIESGDQAPPVHLLVAFCKMAKCKLDEIIPIDELDFDPPKVVR